MIPLLVPIGLALLGGYLSQDAEKFEEGGSISLPINSKISQTELDNFIDYVNSFYGKGGVYADVLDGGFTLSQITKAVNKYIDNLGESLTWGGGDSLDRERVKEFLPYKYAKGGTITYKDLSKIEPETVNEPEVQAKLKDLPIVDLVKVGKVKDYPVDKIKSSQDVVRLIREVYDEDALKTYESAYAVLLNKANKPIYIYEHSKGATDGTIMDVQMIAAAAVKSLSKGVIIIHNHPSGNTQPSTADENITFQMAKAMKYFNISLLDSIIITPQSHLSFAEEGLMPNIQNI